jgi:glycosyltransferase involved in cell wall biosynthesis
LNIRTSIILPVKNGENLIELTLLSLFQNTFVDDEIIIVDDGSTDNTLDIVERLSKTTQTEIKVIKGTNLLASGARNKGLEYAKGEFISFIDHDDLWPKGRLSRHLSLLSEHQDTEAIQGKIEYFSENLDSLKKFKTLPEDRCIFFCQLGSFTYRSSVFKKLGHFNPSLKYGEDLDFYFRLQEAGAIIYQDEPIALRYRIHESNMTSSSEFNNINTLARVLHASIKRKRILTKS